jgi:hypothetical protein
MSYVLFFLAGLGFGYAAVGKWKLTPLVFPLTLAIGALLRDGVDVTSLIKLVIAIVVTVVGIVLGGVLDERTARSQTAGAN